jgi:heme A synthase
MERRSRFGPYAALVLAYNLAVIVWGAYVRATGSGAGCGDHWPTCDGQVLPRPRDLAMLIEFTHRVTSGLSLMLVLGLVVVAFRRFTPGHAARLGAALSGVLILTEALLGAGLVLFRLVAHDTSITRAWFHAAHLVNTFALVAALTLTAWWGYGGAALTLSRRGLSAAVLAGLAGTLLLAVTGGIAALGDTMFPARTLAEGLAQDFSPSAHILLQLRVWHPVAAITVGAYLMAMVWGVHRARRAPLTGAFAWAFSGLFALQLVLGVLNVYLLAPAWLQLTHLFVADLVWVVLVLHAAAALAVNDSAASAVEYLPKSGA